MKKYFSAFVLFLLYSASSFASFDTVSGKVYNVSTGLDNWQLPDVTQKGVFTFFVEGLPNACGDGNPRIAIPTDHPLFNNVVAMVLSAQAQDRSITLNYLESCTYRSNSWDFGTFTIN